MTPNYLKAPEATASGNSRNDRHTVANVLSDVSAKGDIALRDYTRQFDDVALDDLAFSEREIEEAGHACDKELLADMRFVIDRVTAFAEAQLATLKPLDIEVMPGIHLGHRLIPLSRVGAYVPGGRYPLMSSAQMAIIPAKVAGVKEIHVCTPPRTHPAVLYAAHLSGATRIYRVGGAQAIAAFAYGTETIPAVDKIVGPGNKYVNEAKRQVIGQVGIDQLAGPSEIFILADDSADPRVLAADLLGQAEHDVDTRVGLITTSEEIARATQEEVERQLDLLATAKVARTAWERQGEIVICRDEEEMTAYSDYVAAEHLQIHTREPQALAARLTSYGSLFIGQEASVVFSDKACGTNHILPTGRAGRYTGGLWVGTFLKVCTHQWMDQAGVDVLAPLCVRQSTREGLDGHRKAAEIRINDAVV